MSDQEFQMPRKFTFDEFYEMLKEYATDETAREALFTYDQEDMADRGNLLDSSMCSDLACESYGTFKSVGWRILSEHGWPTYSEVIQNTKGDSQKRGVFQMRGNSFVHIGRRVIRKEPIEQPYWEFQDLDIDVMDKKSVRAFLNIWTEKHPAYSLYEMMGDMAGFESKDMREFG